MQNNELGGSSVATPSLPSAPFVVEPAAHFATESGRQRVEAVMQQPLVLGLVVVCSCLVIAIMLLVFVVPPVKRLKKRLKNMELHHEQLSQKASNGGSSIVCSSANSTTGSSMTASGRLPSLSQFTLSSSDRSCAMLPSHNLNHHHQHQTLGRQSSLDSAITSGAPASYQTERYHPSAHNSNNNNHHHHHHHMDINHFNQLQRQQTLLTNGLNQINNGAIVNPVYLHNQTAPATAAQMGQQQQLQRQLMDDLNNIYCPIDDEFYTTINTELEGPAAAAALVNQSDGGHHHHQPAPSGVIVGRTSDSRNYFASQCAPSLQAAHHQLDTTAATSAGPAGREARNTDTPLSRSSSRSSTRSLARFLSLPARHWSHQQQQQQELAEAGVAGKGSFLHELEYHFKGPTAAATLAHPSREAPLPPPPPPAKYLGAQTIARTDRIGQEQHSRPGKRLRKSQSQSTQEQQHSWELERHKLKFLNILDEGQFGQVWRCKLRTGAPDLPAGERTVAVKTLKSFAAKDERERGELLAEIEIMKRVCDHPNVVRILHCCTRDINESKPILLVMEHVELGKLQSFLEGSRASHNYATTSSLYNHAGGSMHSCEYFGGSAGEDEGGPSECSPAATSGQPARQDDQVTSRELIKFIYHVAKGMEYISSNCIVHRDLASRNILISSQRVCKIGDFGMARHVASSCDVYERRSRNTKIPVRWMAPEVLLNNSFTIQSDVYSFGILMWEIVTLGSTPYANLKMEQIIEAVAQAGERPGKPDYCHSLLYNIMSKCWSAQAAERPTFSGLVRQLDELLLSTNEYIELDQYSDHNYYNIAAAPGELV